MKQRVECESEKQRSNIGETAPASRQASFVDNRSSAATQRKLAHMIAQGTYAQRTQMKLIAGETAQRKGHEEEEPAQEKLDPLQRRIAESVPAQLAQQEVPKINNTGLPDNLKSGIESLSGMPMDHVKVHYNSAQPAQLNAHAYAQGSEIHLAPGQERHLPHEAWHVVQQAQGRVQPTMQMKEGVQINDDTGLEREADLMGERAIRHAPDTVQPKALPSGVHSEKAFGQTKGKIVQGLFDWAENAANNRRKAGVEITESNAGGNGISELAPTAAWGLLVAGGAHNALWTHTVNLPDQNGAMQVWHVAAANTMIPANFDYTNGNKNVWMKWGSVEMTEDYGEFEWIIRHPNNVVGVTHYRDRLADASAARTAVRTALGVIPGHPLVMSTNVNPALGEVFCINAQATNDASSQITFESTDRANTKKALLEGLTHGLAKTTVPNRASLVNADADVVATVATAAGRVAMAGVDMELVMAYIVADLCQKMATLIDGASWGGAIAANFKQWRTLFPKSHPSQIMFQAMDPPITMPNITNLNVAIAAQSAAIINDVTNLFARKMRTASLLWSPAHFTAASDPANEVFNAIGPGGVVPGGGIPALQAALNVFLNHHGIVPATEFTNALTALTDHTGVAQDVVRSTGFAVHGGSNKGFAFEDRAEVATQFPDLDTTYARIKDVLNRY